VSIAATIARQKLWGRLRAAALADNSTPEEESLSLLAGLFVKTDQSSHLSESLKDDLDCDDISLFLRFQTIVICTVSQELFHRWRENDPVSARIISPLAGKRSGQREALEKSSSNSQA
jgi:hypothetical protein